MKIRQLVATTGITAVFLLQQVAPTLAAFPDVPATHVYYEAINYVQSKGIVHGYNDGNYRPDWTSDRGAFTKILINARYTEPRVKARTECDPTIASNPEYIFPDVNKSNKFYAQICIAKKDNIIQGFTDGTFRSESMISFGEAAKIISNAYGFTNEAELKVDITNKFGPYIKELSAHNAIPTTIQNGEYKITRGEMAEIMYRILEDLMNRPTKTYEQITGYPSDTKVNTIYPAFQWNFDKSLVTTQYDLQGTVLREVKDRYLSQNTGKNWSKVFYRETTPTQGTIEPCPLLLGATCNYVEFPLANNNTEMNSALLLEKPYSLPEIKNQGTTISAWISAGTLGKISSESEGNLIGIFKKDFRNTKLMSIMIEPCISRGGLEVRFVAYAKGSDKLASECVNTNTANWQNVVMSYNATTNDITLYLNGAKVATGKASEYTKFMIHNTEVVVGQAKSTDEFGNTLNNKTGIGGKIDQISIYQGAASDSVIKSNFDTRK